MEYLAQPGDQRRQIRQAVPFPPYIVDFCCRERKLIIELDGGGHLNQADTDKSREEFLESLGYRILRFKNDQVLKDFHQVYEAIHSVISCD